MLKPGDNLAGYEIVAKLNSGGMAALYLGRRGQAGFASYYAIKVIHSHLAENKAFVDMFLDEARLSARIDHPNVVHVEKIGQANGQYFMVMEYIAGCSLQDLLRTLAKKKLRMTPEVAVAIAANVAAGLHAAHEVQDENGNYLDVVHRDVSPQNVLLAFQGHIKLIDFGIARAADRSQHTQGAVFKGKVRYAAPEQARGEEIDRRADIFALGILLWEMLSSTRLFDGENDLDVLRKICEAEIVTPSAFAPGLPRALEAVVMQTLSKSADRRPQTADDFRHRILDAVPGASLVEAEHIADLLGYFTQEVIDEEVRKLEHSAPIDLLGLSAKSAHYWERAERMVAPRSDTSAMSSTISLPPPLRPAATKGTSKGTSRRPPPPPSGTVAPHVAAPIRGKFPSGGAIPRMPPAPAIAHQPPPLPHNLAHHMPHLVVPPSEASQGYKSRSKYFIGLAIIATALISGLFVLSQNQSEAGVDDSAPSATAPTSTIEATSVAAPNAEPSVQQVAVAPTNEPLASALVDAGVDGSAEEAALVQATPPNAAPAVRTVPNPQTSRTKISRPRRPAEEGGVLRTRSGPLTTDID